MDADPIAAVMEKAPGWREWWASVLRDEFTEPALSYVVMGTLAMEALKRRADGRDSTVAELLTGIEWGLNQQDEGLRKLLVVGFLESLQNHLLETNANLQTWIPLLGPAGRFYWQLLQDLWSRRISPEVFNLAVHRGYVAPK
jgi:hypothetical protein